MVTNAGLNSDEGAPDKAKWKEIVTRYQEPSIGRATWQLVNTLVPYVGLWYVMYLCLSISWWLIPPLAIVAGGLLVRIFIIFHDCGHGSYFKSRTANDILGFITGLMCFTSYHHWRWEHALHHATSGDLDRRGTGDVWTMTVQEYLESSRWKRFSYQLARNPIVLFVIAPLFLFLVWERFPNRKANARERHSVIWMNVAIAALAACLIYIYGIKAYLFIQLTVIAVGSSAGIWLFYVQHQFDGVYWERREDWDYATAALEGSSFYKLPKILQWFSGNIGFHHIHHLSPRIPNYNLQRCHEAEQMFQTVKPLTLLGSLKSMTLRLWDEQHGKMVGYRRVREIRRQASEDRAIAADNPPVNEGHTAGSEQKG